MYALIEKSTNNILRIAAEGTSLSAEKPVEWVVCPDTTLMTDKYDGANFLPKPSQFHNWSGAAWVLDQAAKDAYDAKVAQSTADSSAIASAKADATLQYLVSHTPAECYTKVQNDVTDLPSAKIMLGRFAMILSVLARDKLR